MTRETLLSLPGLTLSLDPDPNVEPGHQWIWLAGEAAGALLPLLAPAGTAEPTAVGYRIRHTADVDARLVTLIDALVAVRLNAPDFVQIHLAGLEPDNNSPK